ncbi:hypothetical protein CK228_24260 [Mesorhizobium sp. WSM4312]|nr:hypothetical protein CK228_24260 [Mesorhizobium sp. WSM4312]
MATAFYGKERVASNPWKTSSLREAVMGLVRAAAMIGGGLRSNEGRDYLGLKLDDPSFTAPIFADEEGDDHSLIWSRPNRRIGE